MSSARHQGSVNAMKAKCMHCGLSESAVNRQQERHRQLAVGEKKAEIGDRASQTLAVYDHSQLAAIPSRKHVIEVAELWDNFKLAVPSVPNHCFPHGSSINQLCIAKVHLVHLNSGFG